MLLNLFLTICAPVGSSSAAAMPEQEPNDDEEGCLNALAQAVLLHPYAVHLLMTRSAFRPPQLTMQCMCSLLHF